jgi:hypothetical protein
MRITTTFKIMVNGEIKETSKTKREALRIMDAVRKQNKQAEIYLKF